MEKRQNSGKHQFGRHEFDRMQPSKSSRLQLVPANNGDIETGWKLANNEIPGKIADISIINHVITYNPNSILLICRDEKIVGIWAMLMLSPIGLEQLLVGELDATKPALNSLTPTDVAPQAIYFWAAVAPGIAAGAVMQISQFLRQPLYRHANCFSRPNTPAGERFNIGMGFKPVECGTPGLMRYVRLANRGETIQQAA